ncbi:MBL fold metallo-hydrolase [Sulfurovum riftiae]|uniref:Metallo-beta-lactamase domain-containing protein n=1 Tax=Sulfurovum riftiae TaxID=1630136 RepID=A0A151CIB2_9BACT|nr:MBL fold metallo-hydrolase [Sulfurovum riftiae]KYJ87275.1 hypothetical protein AS592_02745 [Sulfurovum riftiae]
MLKHFILLLVFTFTTLPASTLSLLILGSGGPEMGDQRASSAYIVKVDGRSRVLIDFGGGASLRFEEAGVHIEELDVILLTHLHIDHTADLPALMKASFFTPRSRDLELFGPEGNRVMPGTRTFIKRLFENRDGAWQYMGDYLDGRAAFRLRAKDVRKSRKVHTIYRKGDLSIQAVSVHHGPIPAMAYRVNVGKKSITFSGDMNGKYHTLERLAKNTDLLLAHNAVPKGAGGPAADLHMTPYTIGQIASKANAGTLILSHRMLRTLGRESETKKEIRKSYKGKTAFADDKSLYNVR